MRIKLGNWTVTGESGDYIVEEWGIKNKMENHKIVGTQFGVTKKFNYGNLYQALNEIISQEVSNSGAKDVAEIKTRLRELSDEFKEFQKKFFKEFGNAKLEHSES